MMTWRGRTVWVGIMWFEREETNVKGEELRPERQGIPVASTC